MQETGAEPDRQLIDADAEPEADQRETASSPERRGGVDLVVIVGEEQHSTEDDQRDGRHVLREGAECVSDRMSEADADHGHRRLEARENEAHTQPRAGEPRSAERGRDSERVEPKRQQQRDQPEHLRTVATEHAGASAR